MPPPPMLLLLPRLGLVVVGANPPNTFSYSLGLDRGRGRHSSSPPSSKRSSKSSRRFSCSAEQPNGAGARSRRWWSDEAQFDEDYDDEFDDEEDDGASFGSAREMFNEPWFTKALRAYGYVLPLILVSMLVATGPQAFLMAMAIPLAQSAVSFAIRAFSSTFGRRDQEEYGGDYYSDYRSGGWEEEPEQEEYSSTKYNNSSSRSRSQQQRQQQPWAKDGKSEDSEPKGESGDADSATGSGSSAGFGGWDELDNGDEQYRNSSSSSSRRSAGPSPAADTATATNAATGGASGSVRRRRPQPERTTTRRRSSRAAARYRQSPLFMRLLVALFPFLGSWFRIML